MRPTELISLDQRFEFSRTAAANYSREFAFTTSENKRIGRIFSVCKPELIDGALRYQGTELPWNLDQLDSVSSREARLIGLDGLAKLRSYDILWSLVHMRFNRLFTQDQRHQEAVVWELLKRSYAMLRATAKTQAALAETAHA